MATHQNPWSLCGLFIISSSFSLFALQFQSGHAIFLRRDPDTWGILNHLVRGVWIFLVCFNPISLLLTHPKSSHIRRNPSVNHGVWGVFHIRWMSFFFYAVVCCVTYAELSPFAEKKSFALYSKKFGYEPEQSSVPNSIVHGVY